MRANEISSIDTHTPLLFEMLTIEKGRIHGACTYNTEFNEINKCIIWN